ncbi:MAG: glycosidase [Bacteroidetes bacterium]|nr:MAG: glycosidase [Bacteroidota bacterium]
MNLIKKIVEIQGGKYEISLNNPVKRFLNNPILTCHDVNKTWNNSALKVITVHNAGVTEFHDKTILLFRSHLRNGISLIGLAKSNNGLSNWEISPTPFLKPCTKNDKIAAGLNINQLIENEKGGVEDPRITKIDDTYFITYSAYHGTIKDRVRISMVTTKDFKSIVRHGVIMDIDMRNVVIFPQKINNKFVALFRPNDNTIDVTGGKYSEIHIGYSDDIFKNKWQLKNEPLMKQGGGPSSFSDKIGPGAPPIKTKYGWLSIFHGVRKTMDGNPYVLGVMLHDFDNPQKIRISNIPVLFPSQDDCKVKSSDYVHVPNVVFSCGARRLNDGTIFIYYGGNDTVLNVGISHEDVLAELCNKYPQNALTGEPLYNI